MAGYFEIYYWVMDVTNYGITHKLPEKEAKELVTCGRCVLWDIHESKKVETPKEWLDSVDESDESDDDESEVENDVSEATVEDLQQLYEEKFGKPPAKSYKNNVEWLKEKIYSEE